MVSQTGNIYPNRYQNIRNVKSFDPPTYLFKEFCESQDCGLVSEYVSHPASGKGIKEIRWTAYVCTYVLRFQLDTASVQYFLIEMGLSYLYTYYL